MNPAAKKKTAPTPKTPGALRKPARGAARRPRQRASAPAAPAASAARPRDRVATEERLLAAVGVVLARDGFKALGVSSVANEARVDKVLIYRYFGGLSELLRAWSASGRFWPSVQDLLDHEGDDLLSRPAAHRWARFLEHFIDELRRRPLTLAILAAEVDERNELTAILESEREEWGHEAARTLGGPAFANAAHLNAITVLLISGIQYLQLRARTVRIFGGIDIRSDAGWDELKAAVRALADRLPGLDSAARGDRTRERPEARTGHSAPARKPPNGGSGRA